MARLARVVGTVVAWGLVLALPAWARQGDDADALNVQVTKLYNEGKYTEAIPLAQRVLAIREEALGPDSTDVAIALNGLALLYDGQGRYAEAEPLYKRALAIDEKALGPDDPIVAAALNNLAELYGDQGRYALAEPLMKRALAIREKALGPDHTDVGQSLNNLAELCRVQRRYAEAEPLYKHSLNIREKALGPDHPDVGQSLNNLALLYMIQGRYGEAEPLYKRLLGISEKRLGPDSPDLGRSLSNLAGLYRDQGRYAEAEPLYKRSLGVYEAALGPDHRDVAKTLNNLAYLRLVQSDWVGAAGFWRRSTGVLIRRAERGSNAVGQALSDSEQNSTQFLGLLKVAHRVAAAESSPDPGLADEMFETAQWARSSEAAASLAQMAARGATANPGIEAIVRERQDLVAEWQTRDAARSAAVSQAPDKRDKQAERTTVARLADIDTRIGEIDKQLADDFPDYAALGSPKPLSIADVQTELHDGEALVLFLDTPEWKPMPEETFIWVVTRTDSRWVRSELGTDALGERVAALRCGLDSSNWADASRSSDATEEAKRRKEAQITRRGRCKTLTGADVTGGAVLPFDVTKAHELYQALFGQVEDLLKNPDGTAKQLLVVPSGPLAQLPFQVLVTKNPDPALSGLEALRHAAWLIRSHALTVLRSVSSLRVQRQRAKVSAASRTLIGFGDPLLDGPDARYGELAKAAREKQSCPKIPWQQTASLVREWRGVLPIKLRDGTANVAQIRRQVPMPETADELCAIARDLGTYADDIWLGARATESEIKRLSEAGDLAKYRMIHFATPGAVSGQVSGDSEPGLLLTPPDKATETDDGYLSASEIAGLKLDADWVILSAFDTAAGDAQGAEALSGLARAFFYAGARALLVSHWWVYSDATVKLITGAISRIAADTSIGRAEAMRQSMLALIDKGAPYEAHPAFWAPFVVVGEGAARSQ